MQSARAQSLYLARGLFDIGQGESVEALRMTIISNPSIAELSLYVTIFGLLTIVF